MKRLLLTALGFVIGVLMMPTLPFMFAVMLLCDDDVEESE